MTPNLNHAITVKDVILTLSAIAGLVLAGTGLLVGLAAGNSPVPDDRMGGQGCAMLVLGIVIAAGAIWEMLS